MPEVLFFDVGNTLITPSPSVSEVFLEVARNRGHSVDRDVVYGHMPALDTLYERLYAEDDSFWCVQDRATAIWIEMYVLLSRLVGLGDDAMGIAHDMHAEYEDPSRWRIFEDVIDTLGHLRSQGFRMGLVSNWDSSLAGVIEGLGLGDYFEVVLSSAVVGLRKPDPAIFQLACEQMNVSPHDVVHVGDHVYADAMGAYACGIKPVIIDRKEILCSSSLSIIRSLTMLPDTLRSV